MSPIHVLPFLALGVFMASRGRADLIHHYTFAVDTSDQVGSADGSLFGGASVSDGVLRLDGVGDYLEFGEKIIPTSGSYSIAMFALQATPQTAYAELISQGFSGAPGLYLGHDPIRLIRAGDAWIFTGVPFPSAGEVHHYALVVDADAASSELYIDGVLRATRDIALPSPALGTNTRLGAQFDSYGEFFAGLIDDVRIYDRALQAAEVAALAPEPGTLALAVLGAAGLVAIASRRRSHCLRREMDSIRRKPHLEEP
jgi:hypothetical protein